MKCTCRRCGTESSVFWYPFVVGYPSGMQNIAPGDVMYLCDRCAYDFSRFLSAHTINDTVLRKRYIKEEVKE